MLVNRTPDTFEKLHILGGMASDDILSRPAPSSGKGGNRSSYAYTSRERNPAPGVYKAAMPNGKFISLMRVMFTDFCMMDCHYCPNSHWVPRKRYAFKVDELAKAFIEMQQRHMVDGLFLSSGIFGSPSKTTERLLKVVELIRRKYGFKGYIHMKVMPGTEYEYVEEAYRLGTRLSINMETPTVEMMRRLSQMKDMEKGILAPMEWIDKLIRNGDQGPGARGQGKNSAVLSSSLVPDARHLIPAVGQATQLVVGAADETDWDIFQRIDQLYSQWNFKRVYYSPFQPVRYTPLEEHPATPMIREHRLYQMDWLRRVYRFSVEEMKLAFDTGGFLSFDYDPKTAIALERLDAFPVDANSATEEQLLRVPGVGPVAAKRIVQNRRRHSIDNWRDLQAMGVVRKRAWPFLAFPGNRPSKAKQLRLDLFGDGRKDSPRPVMAASNAGHSSCGQSAGCAGCPLSAARAGLRVIPLWPWRVSKCVIQ